MAGETVSLRLVVTAEGVEVFDSTDKKVGVLKRDVEDLSAKGAAGFSKFQASVVALNQAFELAAKVGRTVGGIYAELTGEAIAQQNATSALAQTLRSTGQYSRQYLADLDGIAGGFQRLTTFSDDAVLGVERQLVAFGASREQVKQLTGAVLDLSTGMGRDLGGATLLMGKALAGEFSTLGRFGIFVDENASRAKKLEQAIGQISTMFGGQAAAAAATYGGRVEQLGNAFDELKEQLGTIVVGSASSSAGIGTMADRIFDAAEAVDQWRQANETLIDLKIDEVFIAVNEAATAFVETLDSIRNFEAPAWLVYLSNPTQGVVEAGAAFDRQRARERVTGAKLVNGRMELTRQGEPDSIFNKQIAPTTGERVIDPDTGRVIGPAGRVIDARPSYINLSDTASLIDNRKARKVSPGVFQSEAIDETVVTPGGNQRVRIPHRTSSEIDAAAKAEQDAAKKRLQLLEDQSRVEAEYIRQRESAATILSDVEISKAETQVRIAALRLQYGVDDNTSIQTRIDLAQQLDQAERAALDARNAALEQQVQAIQSAGPPTQDQLATVQEIAATQELANAEFAATPGHVAELNRELEKTSKINIGRQLGGNLVQSLLNSNGDFANAASRSLQAIGVQLFDGMLEEKMFFDLEISKNFLNDIPGWFNTGAEVISSTWSSLMSSLAGTTDSAASWLAGSFFSAFRDITADAGTTAQQIGGTLRNIEGVDVNQLASAGSFILSLFSGSGGGSGTGLSSLSTILSLFSKGGGSGLAGILGGGGAGGLGGLIGSFGGGLASLLGFGGAGIAGLTAGGIGGTFATAGGLSALAGSSLLGGGVGLSAAGAAGISGAVTGAAAGSTSAAAGAAGAAAGGIGGGATAGILAAVVFATLGILRSFDLAKGNAEQRDAAGRAWVDPVTYGLFGSLGFGVKETAFASGILTGGISAVLGPLLAPKVPTAEGLVGRGVGDILRSAGYGNAPDYAGGRVQVLHGGGGDVMIRSASTRAYDPRKVGDEGFPQIPPPASYAAVDTERSVLLSELAFQGIRIPGRARGLQADTTGASPVRGVENFAAGMGLSAEDYEEMLRQYNLRAALNAGGAPSDNPTLDEAIFKMRREQRNNELRIKKGGLSAADKDTAIKQETDNFIVRVGALIDGFNELPPAVDAGRLAVLALGKDGELSLAALNRQIATAGKTAADLDLGGSFRAGASRGIAGREVFERTLRQNAGGSLLDTIFANIGESKQAGEAFQAFTARTAEAGEAFRRGDLAEGNALLEKAIADYRAATEAVGDYYDEVAQGAAVKQLFREARIEELSAGHEDLFKGTVGNALTGGLLSKDLKRQVTLGLRQGVTDAVGAAFVGQFSGFDNISAQLAAAVASIEQGDIAGGRSIFANLSDDLDTAMDRAGNFFGYLREQFPELADMVDRVQLQTMIPDIDAEAKGIRDQVDQIYLRGLKPKQREAELRSRLDENQLEIDKLKASPGGVDTPDEIAQAQELAAERRDLYGDLAQVLDDRFADGSARERAAFQTIQDGLNATADFLDQLASTARARTIGGNLSGRFDQGGISLSEFQQGTRDALDRFNRGEIGIGELQRIFLGGGSTSPTAPVEANSVAVGENSVAVKQNTTAVDANTAVMQELAGAIAAVAGSAEGTTLDTVKAAMMPVIISILGDERVRARVKEIAAGRG